MASDTGELVHCVPTIFKLMLIDASVDINHNINIKSYDRYLMLNSQNYADIIFLTLVA